MPIGRVDSFVDLPESANRSIGTTPDNTVSHATRFYGDGNDRQ